MKKFVIILSVLISLISIFIMALPTILRVTSLDKPLKEYIIPKIIDTSTGTLEVDKFNIGYGTLDFTDITLNSSNGQLTIHIDAIALEFSFWDFLLNPASEHHAIRAIYFINPKVIVNKDIPNSVSDSSKTDYNVLREKLKPLEQIQKIIVKNGMIEWRDKKNSTIVAQNLYGWLIPKDSLNIKIDVTGDIFSYSANKLRLIVDVDLLHEDINADIIINNYDLSKSFFSMQKSYIEGLQSGIIDGKIHIANKGINLNNAVVNGWITAKDLAVSSNEVEFEKLQVNAKIINNSLDIKQAKGLLFKAPLTFSAYINNIFAPLVKGRLRLDRISLATLNSFYDLKIPLWARVSLNSDFTVSLNDDFAYNLTSRIKFLYSDSKSPDHLFCKIQGNKDYIQMDNMRSSFKDIALSGMFKYVFGDENVDGYLHLAYKTGKHVLFDKLSDTEQALNIGLRLNLKQWYVDAKWQYLIGSDTTLFSMNGNMHNEANDLLLTLEKSTIKNLSGSLIIKNYNTIPEIKNANIKNFPFAQFTSNKFIKTFFEDLYTEMDLSGSIDELNGSIFVHEKDKPLNDFIFKTTVKDLFTNHKEFFGEVEIKNLKGSFNTFLNSEIFNAAIDFPDGISGELNIDLTADEQLKGELRFTDFKVLKVFSDSSTVDDFRMQGQLNGNIAINGSLDNPQYHSELSADKFVVNEMGYYQAMLNMHGDFNNIFIDSISVSLNNQPYLQGSVHYSTTTDSLKGYFSGNDISLNDVFATFGNKSPLLTGNATYSLDILGTGKFPQLSLNTSIKDGVIAKVDFDNLYIKAEDFLSDSLDFYNINNHNLKIKELSIEKDNVFNLSARGQLPFDKKKKIDLSLSFDGDLFRYLPNWEGFFLDGKSNIHFNADIGGTNSRIRIKSAKLNISGGELWLRDVAPHVQDINGLIEVKEGSNKIDFINFNASVDKQKLTINTVRDIKLSNGEKLKPWLFRDLDLDFGILKLETSEGGLPLHIPGIMKKKEVGNFYLSGQTKDESFYFAGPVKHPRVRGSIYLYNSRVTYPFIISESAKSKPSVAVLFLEKLDWDMVIKAGEDVMYVRDIPAYIDNVHAEVFVDESSPGLHLRGIIQKDQLKALGKFTVSRGELEYLDQTFRVERFAVEFNKFSNDPDVSGRAYTTIRDSIGSVPKTIYLDLYTIDPKTGREVKVTNLDNLRFKLVSAEPKLGETQEQVLASMGYSIDNISEKASSIGGAVADRYLIRPLLRPVERLLEKQLGFDMVRVHSNVAKNLFYNSLGSFGSPTVDNRYYTNPFTSNTSYLHLFQNSEIIVGKYLTQDLYLTYTGRLVSIYNQNKTSFDFNHSIGIEYRFFQNMLLEFQYDRESMGIYNLSRPNYYIQDFKIRLRFQHPISFF